MIILYPIVRLKFQVTAVFDAIETEMKEKLHVMLGRICFNLRITAMGDIEDKPIFVGIIIINKLIKE